MNKIASLINNKDSNKHISNNGNSTSDCVYTCTIHRNFSDKSLNIFNSVKKYHLSVLWYTCK